MIKGKKEEVSIMGLIIMGLSGYILGGIGSMILGAAIHIIAFHFWSTILDRTVYRYQETWSQERISRTIRRANTAIILSGILLFGLFIWGVFNYSLWFILLFLFSNYWNFTKEYRHRLQLAET